MKTTVTTTEAQAQLPRLLRQLPARKSVTITSHGRIAGFLVSKERMEAIIETMELSSMNKVIVQVACGNASRSWSRPRRLPGHRGQNSRHGIARRTAHREGPPNKTPSEAVRVDTATDPTDRDQPV